MIQSIIYFVGVPIGFVIGCRFGYRAMAGEDNSLEVDHVDRVMSMIMGTFVGIFAAFLWPVVLGVSLLKRWLFESKNDRRKRELDEREERIREMEREAGLS